MPDKIKNPDTLSSMLVRDEGGTIVPLFSDQVGAATTRLKCNEPLTGHYEFDGERAFERWWFA